MKRVILAAILLIILVMYRFSATTPPNLGISVTLPVALREIVNENQSAAFPAPYTGLSELLDSIKTPNLDAAKDAEIAERISRYRQRRARRPRSLTHGEIMDELDFLFDLLKHGYGAYQYFGGDDVFLPLKEDMLQQLAYLNSPLSAHFYLNDFLLPFLGSVITDNHFLLGEHQVGISSQLYMNQALVFHETELGFITDINGQTYSLKGVTLPCGLQTEGMLPTLTPDGEFAFNLGYVAYGLGVNEPREALAVDVLLENTHTNELLLHSVNLFPVSNAAVSSRRLYNIRNSYGFTILENRILSQRSGLFSFFGPNLDDFALSGASLRDEPVLILDLRGHSGGNDSFAYQWIRHYTNQSPQFGMSFSHIRLNSLTTNQIAQWIEAASPPRWQVLESDYEPTTIQNENLLIVLMDNAIGSSGESFIGLLRQLDNVLFVGANTRGVLVTGNVGRVVLPFSRLNVHLGVSLNMRPDLSQFEGVGFMPDLWVPPEESLYRVIKFLLNEGEPT